MATREEVTVLLRRASEGGKEAVDQLFPLVFQELRRLADAQLHREGAAHTLQPTALVHEAYLRMVDQDAQFESRLQFFNVAAMMMRRILVDHARGKQRDKRGSNRQRVELTASLASAPETEVDLLALDEALERLDGMDERKARIVELRYFAGRTIDETASLLGVSSATVSRDWEVARLWLLREVSGERGA
jgi:RNA polymerase sigma factor (TIGR02999 family)